MLRTGQIVKTPDDGTLRMLRVMTSKGLGSVLGVQEGTPFLICAMLAAAPGVELGDYMAVVPGRTTFYLLPGKLAESWQEVDPTRPDPAALELEKELAEVRAAHAELHFAIATITGQVNPGPALERAGGLLPWARSVRRVLQETDQTRGEGQP